jgi:hypothetical protein
MRANEHRGTGEGGVGARADGVEPAEEEGGRRRLDLAAGGEVEDDRALGIESGQRAELGSARRWVAVEPVVERLRARDADVLAE